MKRVFINLSVILSVILPLCLFLSCSKDDKEDEPDPEITSYVTSEEMETGNGYYEIKIGSKESPYSYDVTFDDGEFFCSTTYISTNHSDSYYEADHFEYTITNDTLHLGYGREFGIPFHNTQNLIIRKVTTRKDGVRYFIGYINHPEGFEEGYYTRIN